MALLRKRVTEIRKNLYERLDNDAKAFRHDTEEEDMIRMKAKYIEKHLKNLIEQEKEKESVECIGYLAVAYLKLGRTEDAKKSLERQLELSVEFKDEHMQRMALGNLGVVYRQEFNLSKAMDSYKASLEIAIKHNNKYAQCRLYNNMANIEEQLMNFQPAIEYQLQNLSVAKVLKNRDTIVKACGSLSAYYHAIDDLESSLSYLEQLMDQLRKNLKVKDTLADDASDSDDGGYITIEENEEEAGSEDGDGGGGGTAGGSAGILAKIKKKIFG